MRYFAHGWGAMAAAPVLLEGKDAGSPKKAKGAGPDRMRWCPADELLARAKEDGCLQASDADIVKPWTRKAWKMPGGAPYHPAGGSSMTFVGASAMINGKTKGVYPRRPRRCMSGGLRRRACRFRHLR